MPLRDAWVEFKSVVLAIITITGLVTGIGGAMGGYALRGAVITQVSERTIKNENEIKRVDGNVMQLEKKVDSKVAQLEQNDAVQRIEYKHILEKLNEINNKLGK